MQIHDIWLVAVSHFLHVVFCQFRETGIRKIIFGSRIEGNMKNRFFRIPVGKQITFKSPQGLPHQPLRIVCNVGDHAVARYDTGQHFVHFLLVVGHRSVKRCAPVDFRYHVFQKLRVTVQVLFLELTGQGDNLLAEHYQLHRDFFQFV